MNHKESSSRKNERAKLDKTERQWKGSKRWRRRAKNTNMLSTRKTQKNATKGPSEDMGWPRECGRGGGKDCGGLVMRIMEVPVPAEYLPK